MTTDFCVIVTLFQCYPAIKH